MRYMVTADTDIGISKNTNQDSVLVKHAKTELGEIVLAVICDGMGGLSKGELASATVIRTFDRWFHEQLPHEMEQLDYHVIGEKWCLMLKELNEKILEYGKQIGSSLGTTFSGMLIFRDQYVIVHVGDSRVYRVSSSLEQLTTDQTFVAREIRKGTMTEAQAKVDKRRNLLLQCVGASKNVEPEVLYGSTKKGAYMLCSDGFRHEITPDEILESLNPINLRNKETMRGNVRYLIELVKSRMERDNISVILIKAE